MVIAGKVPLPIINGSEKKIVFRLKVKQGTGELLTGSVLFFNTDEEGNYSFELPAGIYLLSVQLDGVYVQQGKLTVNHDSPSPLNINQAFALTEELVPSEIIDLMIGLTGSAGEYADLAEYWAGIASQQHSDFATERAAMQEVIDSIPTLIATEVANYIINHEPDFSITVSGHTVTFNNPVGVTGLWAFADGTETTQVNPVRFISNGSYAVTFNGTSKNFVVNAVASDSFPKLALTNYFALSA